MPRSYRDCRKRKHAFGLTRLISHPLSLYDHLPFQIAVVSNLLQLNRDIAIRDIIDLEPRELRVILNIGSYMPIMAADIAYQARLDSYTVSRAVKKLKSLKLANTHMQADNKKSKFLVLTAKGKDVYARLCEVIQSRTNLFESVLSSKEKTLLMETLAKLEDQVESILGHQAQEKSEKNQMLPADQKELIRWMKKSQK